MTAPQPAKPVYRAVCWVPKESYWIQRDGILVAVADVYNAGWALRSVSGLTLSGKFHRTPQMAATEAKRRGLRA